jgi:pimeloyl-[acyl-carrier protein] methyl ester esterase
MSARRWLLLPGWGFPAALWTPVAEALRGLDPGAEIEAIDLPQAATPWQAVDALAASHPGPSSIVGWSLGAMLALAWAGRYPAQVERLVLAGATPRFLAAADWPHGLSPDLYRSFGALAAPGGAARARARIAALSAHGDGAAHAVLGALRAAQRAAPAGHPLPGLGWLEVLDLRDQLAALRQPVRLVHGLHDALVPVAAARWLAAALPDATLVIDEHAGHAPFAARAAAFAAQALRWAVDERRAA